MKLYGLGSIIYNSVILGSHGSDYERNHCLLGYYAIKTGLALNVEAVIFSETLMTTYQTIRHRTEQADVAVTLQNFIPPSLLRFFRGFLQFLHANTRIVPLLGHYCFLSYSAISCCYGITSQKIFVAERTSDLAGYLIFFLSLKFMICRVCALETGEHGTAHEIRE